MDLSSQLAQFLKEQGLECFAFGNIERIKKEFPLAKEMDLTRYNFAISIAYPLLGPVLETIKDRPTLLYKHLYTQVNNYLDKIALQTSSWLSKRNVNSIPIPASQIVDWEKFIGHLSHREIARELSMGEYGINNLLVTPRYGARVRLVSILLDTPVELKGEQMGKKLDCESCLACIEVCPAFAISKKLSDFNKKACFDKCKEFEKIKGIGQRICGVCVKACKGAFRG